MKRDIFSRGVRMQHQFGETEKINDPLGLKTFDLPLPENRLAGHSPGCEIQQQGQHTWPPPLSPVQKPSGQLADINGPAPDNAAIFATPIPVGTKRRLGPPKTDK